MGFLISSNGTITGNGSVISSTMVRKILRIFPPTSLSSAWQHPSDSPNNFIFRRVLRGMASSLHHRTSESRPIFWGRGKHGIAVHTQLARTELVFRPRKNKHAVHVDTCTQNNYYAGQNMWKIQEIRLVPFLPIFRTLCFLTGKFAPSIIW